MWRGQKLAHRSYQLLRGKGLGEERLDQLLRLRLLERRPGEKREVATLTTAQPPDDEGPNDPVLKHTNSRL